ncbi:MAG: LemA family protein, partial [Caldiserica bacterium]|nr:LemA family protein [Caldisericota bacterium]
AEEAFRARLRALEEFLAALRRAGYVPEGQRELRAFLDEARGVEFTPRSIAELDERLRAVLWRIFAALPRERPPGLRESQNRLAEAAEEFDIARRRYNDLARIWNGLLLRFPYRIVAARRRLSPRDLLPVRSEWELI